jgi:hypothetical protein
MIASRQAIAFGVALTVFGAAVFAQRQANEARAQAEGDEILYLPNQKILNHFTGGMNNVVADLLWLRCIQYVGKENKGERNFTWLNQMLETVVQLDPYFGDAYRYGGMFLASLRADDDAGIDLLERGFIANPNNFQLPYELAMIFLLNRKDEPGSKERATYYLSMAAAIEGCPEFIRDLATKLQGQYNLVDVEREMWQRMAGGSDKLLRELGERKLVEMDIRKAVENLNQAVLMFNQRHGRFPATLDEMVQAGLLKPLGPDPLGGTFFMGEDSVIRNTTLLDEDKNNRLKVIRNQLNSFQNKNGRWPNTLEELVERGQTKSIPEHPYPGESWRYDAATGEVE